MCTSHFADRLCAQILKKDSRVVVGLDPRWESLPQAIRRDAVKKHGRTLDAAADAFGRFAAGVIEQVAPFCVAVKPQIACFEACGPEGFSAYQEVVRTAQDFGLLVIGDAKRGDIGATCESYAAAHLGGVRIAGKTFHPLVTDAVTVNPYMGIDSVQPFLDAAASTGRGVFVLVKTSNPSSSDFQDTKGKDGRRLYERVAARAHKWGRAYKGKSGYSLLGAVVGATYPRELAQLRKQMPKTPLLIPGYGAQGGSAGDLACAFDADGLGAVVNASRSVIYAFKGKRGRPWTYWVKKAAQDMQEAINQAVKSS